MEYRNLIWDTIVEVYHKINDTLGKVMSSVHECFRPTTSTKLGPIACIFILSVSKIIGV